MMHNLEEKIARYFGNRQHVVAVYLFGSVAGGKVRPSSDIDIGVILDDVNRDVSNRVISGAIVELGRILRKDVHPVIMNTASDELLRQIFSKGSCILVNDAGKLARHRMVMFARLADFGYYRRQMQSGFIRRVMEESHSG
jgi:predicted nucleotidyltransferase